MCMTDSNFSKRLAFLFLEDIMSEFTDKYSEDTRNKAIAYELNSFEDNISTKMAY